MCVFEKHSASTCDVAAKRKDKKTRKVGVPTHMLVFYLLLKRKKNCSQDCNESAAFLSLLSRHKLNRGEKRLKPRRTKKKSTFTGMLVPFPFFFFLVSLSLSLCYYCVFLLFGTTSVLCELKKRKTLKKKKMEIVLSDALHICSQVELKHLSSFLHLLICWAKRLEDKANDLACGCGGGGPEM